MFRTLPRTRDFSESQRLAAIVFFTALTALFAKISIGNPPVPFTMQVLAVLLSGMVLGARDGALSQVAYLGLIAANMPLDANSLGAAAFAGPTAGYLVAFVPAAWLTGFLVQHGANRVWQRWIASVAGIAVIYVIGVTVLKLYLGMSWGDAWMAGVYPFLGLDLVKAVIAAAATESGRAMMMRLFNPPLR